MTRLAIACLFAPLAFAQIPTTTTLSSSANPAVFGQVVTLSASVSPSQATGSVTFYDGTTVLGTHKVLSGNAAISVILPSSGMRSLKGRFIGVTGYAASVSPVLAQTVNPVSATTLQAATQYSTGTAIGNQHLAAADFNGDGHLDIVTTSYTVLLGNGDGTFQKPVVYMGGSTAEAIVTGDFNGDGKPDFATARDDGNIGVWLNNGDGTFQAPLVFPSGADPIDIATGDFNNDGILDIAVSSPQGGATGIGVFLGVGDGTFKPVVTYLSGTPQSFLAVADFNGDGNADVVAANMNAGDVTILLGNGDGTFTVGATYGGNYPQFVAVGDFNRDGKPDLVLTGYVPSRLTVYLGNGDGTFTETKTSPIYNGFLWSEVAVGDFDGDGIPDLAVSTPNASQPVPISILSGNGDGTFRGAVNFPAGSTSGVALIAGEFNGDGRTDLAVTTESGQVAVLPGGAGAFPTVTTTSLPAGMAGVPYSATLAATGGTMPYTWTVSAGYSPFENISTGTIAETLSAGTEGGDYAFTVMVSGPNGPGFFSAQDFSVNITPLVSINNVSLSPTGRVGIPYSVTFSASGGTPPYRNWTVISGTTPPGLTLNPSTGVLSGTPTMAGGFSFTMTVSDSAGLTSVPATMPGMYIFPLLAVSTISVPNALTGVPYYAALNATGGLGVYGAWTVVSGSLPPGLTLNSASGVISGTPTTASGSPFAFSVSVRDGGGNGIISAPQPFTIAVANPASVTLTLGTSANPVTFGKPLTLTATLSTSGGSGEVTFYDGTSIIGTASAVSGRAVIGTSLLVPGMHKLTARVFGPLYVPTLSGPLSQVVNAIPSASFEAPVGYASGYSLTPVLVADFNGDGKADLATFGSVLLGNGDGTFGTPLVHAVGSDPVSMVIADFNEDGVPDIAVSDTNGVEVFAGKGDGTFASAEIYDALGPLGVLAVADFNGDGHADLLFNETSGQTSLYLGVGDGTFRAAQTVAPGLTYAGAIAVDDFNGDGKPDIAIGNAASGTVNILLGNGDGTFQAPVAYIVPIGYGANSLLSADLNRDGIRDLVVNANGDVYLMIGHGDGTFGKSALCCNGDATPAIITDFNGDGIPDLAVPSGSYISVANLLLGNGDGTFGAAVPYVVGNGAAEFAVGDFNGDGRPDIVAGNGGGTVYAQMGAATSADSQLTLSPAAFAVTASLTSSSASQTITLSYQTDTPGAPTFQSDLADSGANGYITVVPASGTMTLASHSGSLYTYAATVNVSVPSGAAYRNTVAFGVGGPIVSLPVTVSSLTQQTISFPYPAQVNLPALPFTLNATASSGLTVIYTSSTPGVCTVSGSTLTPIAAGACVITASQPGNGTYAAATPVTDSFSIIAATIMVQTITFAAPAAVTLPASPFTLTATASSGLPVTFTSSTTSVCTVSGATLSPAAVGTCTITASQPGNSTYAPATPVTQSFTISSGNPLSVSPSSVAIIAQVGGSPGTQAVTVSYQTFTPGAPNWSSTLSTNQGKGWIGVSPSSGTMTQASYADFLYTYTATVTISCNQSSFVAGNTYTGSVSFSAGVGAASAAVSCVSSSPQITGIVNAASAGQAIASVVSPGSYIAIYGKALAGGGNPLAATTPLPTTLNGTSVTLGGLPLPLLFASSGQVNAIVPQGLAPNNAYRLLINGQQDLVSNPVTLLVLELQPGIYTVDTSGSGAGIVADALTGQLINASNPAKAGQYLVVYCTGLGPVLGPNGEAAPADGVAAPGNLLYSTVAGVTATIGGVGAPVSFSGLTPTFVGLYQVNVQMPSGVTPGNSVKVVLTATDAKTGATGTSNTVTIVTQ